MNIYEIRSELGLTQVEFADKFQIPVRTIQRWEQNQNPTPTYILYMISRIISLEKTYNKLRMEIENTSLDSHS